MLNPKEYRYVRTEILTYNELLRYDKDDYGGANSVLASRYFDCEIKKYQKKGYVVKIGNMTSDMINSYRDLDGCMNSILVLYSLHLMLYKPI